MTQLLTYITLERILKMSECNSNLAMGWLEQNYMKHKWNSRAKQNIEN